MFSFNSSSVQSYTNLMTKRKRNEITHPVFGIFNYKFLSLKEVQAIVCDISIFFHVRKKCI